jgi:hypothetical protein
MYQMVDQGAKDRLNTVANAVGANMPRPNPTNPVSVYSVANAGDKPPETPVIVPNAGGVFPSAHLSGPARGDNSSPQVVMGKDPSKTTTMAKAERAPALPTPPAVPSVTSKEASVPVYMATPAPKPPVTAPTLVPPTPNTTASLPASGGPAPADKPPGVPAAGITPPPVPAGVITPAALLNENTIPPAPTPAMVPADNKQVERTVDRAPDYTVEKTSERPKQVPGSAMMRVVNNRHITLNFKVEDVGPSGISNIEVWATQDCKVWKKYEVAPNAHTFAFDAEDEGIYGFTMLARSGIGLGKEPPQPGDLPQVWVLVDTTRPIVQMHECTAAIADRAHTITIRWKASDKNLGSTPITLSYAEREEGPWTPIATRIENSGGYVWKPSDRVPAKLLVRVEATDLAGNIGVAQTSRPVLLDASMPNIAILDVEGGRE